MINFGGRCHRHHVPMVTTRPSGSARTFRGASMGSARLSDTAKHQAAVLERRFSLALQIADLRCTCGHSPRTIGCEDRDRPGRYQPDRRGFDGVGRPDARAHRRGARRPDPAGRPQQGTDSCGQTPLRCPAHAPLFRPGGISSDTWSRARGSRGATRQKGPPGVGSGGGRSDAYGTPRPRTHSPAVTTEA